MPQCEYVSSSTGVRCSNSSPDIKLDSRNHCEIHGIVNYVYDNIVSAKQQRIGAPPKLEIKVTDVRGNIHDKIGWVGRRDDEEMLRCSSDWLQYNNFEADDNMFYENFSGTTIHGNGPFTELEVLKNQEIMINEEIKMLEKLKALNDEELASKNAFYRHAMLQELCSGAFVVRTPEEVRLCGEIQDLYKYGASKEREHESLVYRSNVYRNQKNDLQRIEDESRDRGKRSISESLSEKDDGCEEENWYLRKCCLESLENGKCDEVVLWPSAYCYNHLKFDKNQVLYESCQECHKPYIPPLECTNCLTNQRIEKSKQLVNQNPRMLNVRPNFDIRRNIPTMRMKGFDSSIVIPIRKVHVKKIDDITSHSKFELKHIKDEVEVDLNDLRGKELLEDVKENIVFGKDSGEGTSIELIDNYFSEIRVPVKQLPPKSVTQVPPTVTLPDRRHNPFTNVNKPPLGLSKPIGALNSSVNQKFTRGPQRAPRRTFEAIRLHPILGAQFKQNPCAKIRPFTKEYFPASEGSLQMGRRPYITTGNNLQKIKMIVMKPVMSNNPNSHSAPPRPSGAFYFRNTRTTQ
uniref:SET domain-containing protein n=1 Tax=Strongyloides venezuelensis TaxID=75913 RepID=A0A0K0F0I5_STRVS